MEKSFFSIEKSWTKKEQNRNIYFLPQKISIYLFMLIIYLRTLFLECNCIALIAIIFGEKAFYFQFIWEFVKQVKINFIIFTLRTVWVMVNIPLYCFSGSTRRLWLENFGIMQSKYNGEKQSKY